MGLGYKNFVAGAVLTEAEVDGYLMRQTVMSFASASARDSALAGVLEEGMTAYLRDVDRTTVYNGTSWTVETPQFVRDGAVIVSTGIVRFEGGSSVVNTNANGDANLVFTNTYLSKPHVMLMNGDPNFPFFFVLNNGAITTSTAPFRAHNPGVGVVANGAVRVNYTVIGHVA